MAWSLCFFSSFNSSGGCVVFFSSWCWILHLFWFGWRVEFADLMGLFRLGIEAGIQFHVEGFSIVAQPPESLVELAT